MKLNPYTVIRFDETSFHTLFSDGRDKSLHSKKTQVIYLCDYLKNKGAKTIVIENEYIDRSYLEDYSSYYSRCFNAYEKKCRRLHFFKDYNPLPGFSEEEFRQWMFGNDGILTSSRLQDNYLGFVVVKPLPETVIGRTCLEAYPETSEGKTRFFPVLKTYEAGLCGLRLKVRRTLPFQEQDKITSACATSALWSLFHASSINGRLIKSPSSITKIATSSNFSSINDLPTPGLTPEMMGVALLSEGLEPLVINLTGSSNADSHEPLIKAKSYIYPYLKNKIPVLLAVDALKKEGKYVHKGRHAVAVCGYSLQKDLDVSGRQISDFVLKSEFVDKIYVHDDQVGPFARLDIVNSAVEVDLSKSKDFKQESLASYLRCNVAGQDNPYIYSPTNVIIGLYHKIRISFLLIEECAAKFSYFLYESASREAYTKDLIYTEEKPLIWDMFLTTPTEIKEEVYRDNLIPADRKQHILGLNLPRYMWRVSASNSNSILFDLLFDATDIPQGTIFLDMIERDAGFRSFIDLICPNLDAIPVDIKKDKYGTLYKVLEKLCTRWSDSKPGLAEKYGFPRPPLRLKPEECNGLGEVEKHPCLIAVDERDDELNLETENYIWAISESGDIRMAIDCGGHGHPTLVEGAYARICGELRFENGAHVLNNASGRYSKHNPSGCGEFLENAKSLFESRIPSLRIARCEESPYHGTLSITGSEDFMRIATDALVGSEEDEAFKVLWEIGRRTPELRVLFCKNITGDQPLEVDALEQVRKLCYPEGCRGCSFV